MKKRKVCLAVCVVAFLLMLAAPILTINRVPGRVSETENRYLAKFPDLFNDEGHLNTNLKSGIENWLSDNIGFRASFTELAANIKLRLFRQSPSDKVEIGRDGWFFYAGDHNIDIARGEYPDFDENVLEGICNIQLRIQQRLKEQGIEYVLILPPSNVSIYPEFVASGDYSVTETPVDILADYLEEHTDIKVIRLKEALLAAKDSGQLFFRTDTHWNEYGATVAYQEIIRKLNEWNIIREAPAEVTFTEGTYQGEISGLMGAPGILEPESTLKSVITDPVAIKVESGEKYEAMRNAADTCYNGRPCFLYENETVDTPKVTMIGDSLFGGDWNIREQMAESFSEFSFYWSDFTIYQGAIDAVKPDVLFYEVGERYLSALFVWNLPFIEKPLGDFSCCIQDYQWDENGLRVTVLNDSNSSWDRYNQIRLGLWTDGYDTACRAQLPVDVTVFPGESYTFSFDKTVTDSISSDNIEVTMLQEGICFFGELYPVQKYKPGL